MALTVMQRLLHRCGVRTEEVGWLQVGSTSLLDRSKSTKTELMALVEAHGSATAEGVDAISDAAALLGCVSWTQGVEWDGRWAVAVCSMALAMLVGPSATLCLQSHFASCLETCTTTRAFSRQCSKEDAMAIGIPCADLPSPLLSVLSWAPCFDTVVAMEATLRLTRLAAHAPHQAAAFGAITARRARGSGRFSWVAISDTRRSSDTYYLAEVTGCTPESGDSVPARRYTPQIPCLVSCSPSNAPLPKHNTCTAVARGALVVPSEPLLSSVGMGSAAAASHDRHSVDASAAVREAADELLPVASADAPLMEAGLDSLGAVEFRNRLTNKLGESVQLPETVVFDFPTLRQLEAHLSPCMQPAAPPVARGEADACSAHTAVVLAQLLGHLGMKDGLAAPGATAGKGVDVPAVMSEVTTELIPDISADAPLMEAGLDSLGAVEFRNRLAARLGDAIELPETVVFDFPTLRQLEEHLCSRSSPPTRVTLKLPNGLPKVPHPPTLQREEVLTRCNASDITVVGESCMLPASLVSMPLLAEATATAKGMMSIAPASRWDAEHVPPGIKPDVADRTRHGAFVQDATFYDNARFAISPAEATAMDPQQRLLLETGYTTLHASGRDKAALSGSGTGVAVGIYATEFLRVLEQSALGRSVYAAANALSIASGRVSFALGLHGPCASFETACSASLVSCHSAVRALQHDECQAHLAAGVNLMLVQSSSVGMAIAGMTSVAGRCHTLDNRADGFARGEGVSGVILAHSAAAVDLPGSAVRQDGRSASLTAPNGQAQQSLLCAALDEAGATMATHVLTELHGTGTPLGDPIEAGSLAAAVLSQQGPGDSLVCGGLKANLGHGESTAGVSGLLQLILSIVHSKAPANAQLRVLNPRVGSVMSGKANVMSTQLGRVHVAVSRTPTEQSGGVSSFGYSGTIVHAALRTMRHVSARAPQSMPLVY